MKRFVTGLLIGIVLVGQFAKPVQAQIYRVDTGEVIPGTEGITLGPGVRLDHRDLQHANLSSQNLMGASFIGTSLEGADFTNAVVLGASFSQNFAVGRCNGQKSEVISAQQLYSTASYRENDLRDMLFGCNDLSGWNLSGQDLRNTRFDSADMSGVDLSGANVTGANFGLTSGFAREQLYSTASYKRKNLTGMNLDFLVLEGWDLSGQDLTDARLEQSILTSTDLSGANLTGAQLWSAEFEGTNLSSANLTRAELADSQLSDVDFSDAVVRRAAFLVMSGFTKEHLYSTASYKSKDLLGIVLVNNNAPDLLKDIDLSEQDLRGAALAAERTTQQDLTNANFRDANLALAKLSHVKLAGADLRGANLGNTTLRMADLASAQFDATTMYTEWTRWPEGFDPEIAGLTFVTPTEGDFDANGVLDAMDLEFLQEFAAINTHHIYRFNPFGSLNDRVQYEIEPLFDLNDDGQVDLGDHQIWVKDLKQTYYGDANLDGEFNSGDLVHVFAAGEYEDETRVNSTWATGDWNGDWDFTSADIIVAFQDGGYEQEIRNAIAAVPEPSSCMLAMSSLILITFRWKLRRKDTRMP